jgi:LPXTG-site transpeptidase (sortase) family protein
MQLEKNAAEGKLNISSILIKMGLIILALSFCAFLFYYFPIISKEIMYVIQKPDASEQVTLVQSTQPEKQKEKVIVAADKEFSIVIPKIGANSKVVKNVDPYNSIEYQQKLTQGVAHAKGTSLPGEAGNSFYFAHSSDNFYNANMYNSVFYLLNKLTAGDLFYLIYTGTIYRYKVTDVKVVNAEDISYLKGTQSLKTATLMTCWPAGTTLKRLVVLGELVN